MSSGTGKLGSLSSSRDSPLTMWTQHFFYLLTWRSKEAGSEYKFTQWEYKKNDA